MSLSERAILVTLRISKWTGHKLDRSVTDETNARHHAAQDASRTNKLLLRKEAFAAITKADSAARSGYMARTAPWSDDGVRIINAAAYKDFVIWAERAQADFRKAAADFLAAYPDECDAARDRLGTMYRAADYPDVSDLADRYRIRFGFHAVPDAGDFRVDVPEHDAEQIRAAIRQEVETSVADANRDTLRRVFDAAQRMVDRLAAYDASLTQDRKAPLHQSVVGNIETLVDLLPSLNIGGDQEIDAMADRLKSLIGHSVDELKDDARARQETAQAAKAIVSDMAGVFA